MDDVAALVVREFVGGAADQLGKLPRVEGDHAAGDHALRRIDEVDHVARLEIAVHTGDSGREQRASPPDHGASSTAP